MPPTLLYRDHLLVVVNKPSGLLVHRSPVDSRETRFAVQAVRDLLGQRVYPVHRLDKPTSGVLLFALSSEVAASLSRQFQAGSVDKRYLAVVRGHPPAAGVIDHAFRQKADERAGTARDDPAESAVSRYRTLDTVEWPDAVDRYPQARYALVEVVPETGRRHQIRRHLKHIHHPIIGDTTYGKATHNRYFRDRFDCHRLLLHAASLTIDHPDSGDRLQIQAPLDTDFQRVIAAAGWRLDAAGLQPEG